jgi:hypothetical protein
LLFYQQPFHECSHTFDIWLSFFYPWWQNVNNHPVMQYWSYRSEPWRLSHQHNRDW